MGGSLGLIAGCVMRESEDTHSSLGSDGLHTVIDFEMREDQEPWQPFVLRAGVRRDRSAQFKQSRSRRRPAPRAKTLAVSDTASGYLHDLHRAASEGQTSLVSKLAAHRGHVRFGTEFGDRAPPMELRIALPKVEAAIEKLFAELSETLSDLRALEISAENRRSYCAKTALLSQIESFLEKTMAEFTQQCDTSDQLRVRSPLLAPRLSQDILARLEAAFVDMPSGSGSTTAPSTPRCSKGSIAGAVATARCDV